MKKKKIKQQNRNFENWDAKLFCFFRFMSGICDVQLSPALCFFSGGSSQEAAAAAPAAAAPQYGQQQQQPYGQQQQEQGRLQLF